MHFQRAMRLPPLAVWNDVKARAEFAKVNGCAGRCRVTSDGRPTAATPRESAFRASGVQLAPRDLAPDLRQEIDAAVDGRHDVDLEHLQRYALPSR